MQARAAKKSAAALAQGVPVKIIPGVTAAAASVRPLTERGRFDRVLMLTAPTMMGE